MISKFKEIDVWLKSHLDDERYRHSHGTADCARELAQKYGLDANKAYITGLLHDCAKCLPIEQQKKIILECTNFDEEDLDTPKIFHGPVGAYITNFQFGIEDDDVLSAIECHTVGKRNMTTFEKIIFLADKIEPEMRDADWIKEVSAVLDQPHGLDKALLLCYKATIRQLVKKGVRLNINTILLYNDLVQKVNA